MKKCSSCATYLISSWARIIGRYLYVPTHCVVLNVLATFASSVVRILMETKVSCHTIFVKVASLKVSYTMEVINTVLSLGMFLFGIGSFDRVRGNSDAALQEDRLS